MERILVIEDEESILMASNHLDVRVLEATLRSMDRDVKNRFIIGKEVFSSKLQQLRMLLLLLMELLLQQL